MAKKQEIDVELPAGILRRIDAICAIEKIDRSQLLEQLIQEGLRKRANDKHKSTITTKDITQQ